MFEYKKKISFISGTKYNFDGPFKLFDKNIIEFLDKVSKEIFKSKISKYYPDLISLAFWIRRANILSLSKNYKIDNRFGRGTILHISPSNIPFNFVYSLVFGLLSGNNNIVRLPSKKFDQVNIFLKILKKIKSQKKFKSCYEKFSLLQYSNSDEISQYLSKLVEGRIIWGGDQTIEKFKKFDTQPRCVDLYFSGRFSASVIDLEKFQYLTKRNVEKLLDKFAVDAYYMSQYGCSSPNIIFWKGKRTNKKTTEIFWKKLNSIIIKKNLFEIHNTNIKLANMYKEVTGGDINKQNLKISLDNFSVLRSKLNQKSKKDNPIKNGFFYEYFFENFKEIKKYLTIQLQTLTYFGCNPKDIKDMMIKNKIKGIDRIVPIGSAFNISTKWDGYDIIYSLSRVIDDQI